MPTFKKTKVQNNKKSKISKKSKTRKNISGGGMFSPTPSIFKNLVYPKSYTGYSGIPELQCSICKKNIFKMRTMKISTWSQAIMFNTDIFDNRFKFFTCTNCGKIEILSDRVTLQQIKIKDKKK